MTISVAQAMEDGNSENMAKKQQHSSSKLSFKQNELLKKMMPKTGSYDLSSANSVDFDDDLLNNDNIKLNSAEPLDPTGDYNNAEKRDRDSRWNTMIVKNVEPASKKTVVTNANKLSKNKKTAVKSDDEKITRSDLSKLSFPTKKSILGLPLTCFTYFAAIYSLLAYGATSLVSIIELMTNESSSSLLPLYILIVGYLLITLITFMLIVAIQRESLNLVLLWVIALTVFILPEIGLNIVLAENTFNWFETAPGFYTLVALVIRVTLDIPCIGIVLAYHIDRSKRNLFLRKMMLPLKRNIVSGDMLRTYNNLEMKNAENLPQMPRKDSRLSKKSVDIGFNKIENEICENNPDLDFKCNEEIEPSESNTNRVRYKFAPNAEYEIIVRPSQNNEFSQRFVNINDIKINHNSRSNANIKHASKSSRVAKSRHQDPLPMANNVDLEKINLTNNNMFLLNDNDFQEKYINQMTNKSKMINLANHHIYLPPTSSPSLIDRNSNYLMPLNELTNLDHTNDTTIDEHSENMAYQTDLLNVSPKCHCVNIMPCKHDKIDEFLHSSDCKYAKNLKSSSNDNSKSSIGFSVDFQNAPPPIYQFTQRKHF